MSLHVPGIDESVEDRTARRRVQKPADALLEGSRFDGSLQSIGLHRFDGELADDARPFSNLVQEMGALDEVALIGVPNISATSGVWAVRWKALNARTVPPSRSIALSGLLEDSCLALVKPLTRIDKCQTIEMR